jgi:hypothetical protein
MPDFNWPELNWPDFTMPDLTTIIIGVIVVIILLVILKFLLKLGVKIFSCGCLVIVLIGVFLYFSGSLGFNF